MSDLAHEVYFNEQKAVSDFFGFKEFDLPALPDWVNDESLAHWESLNFDLHFLPKIKLTRDLNLSAWLVRPEKIFYKQIDVGSLPSAANELPGRWILIDGRDKPGKINWWVSSCDVWLLEKVGFHPKNYFKKKTEQRFTAEYLTDELKGHGFGSRFCLSIRDIEMLMPMIASKLCLPEGTMARLPRLVEYNYLGNSFYKQWATTKTWEWMSDVLPDGQHLASGAMSVGTIGWDPADFWSTILTFRPIVDL